MPFRFKLLFRKLFAKKMSGQFKEVPCGVVVIQKLAATCCPRRRFNRQLCYQSSILFLTYVSYMCYHLTRKPISVVKSVLHQNCSSLVPPPDIIIDPTNNATWCDWAPFDGADSDATALLGTLDSAFLFAYAIAMFFSGLVAERVNLRYFLSLGMILSGAFSYMFGIARSYDIHSISYFIFVQAAAGIAQTTGWPGVVTVVGKWFGKGKRGLIFGIWNSHTSIGNILGTVIAARFVETDWSLSFIIPGFIMAVTGFMVFLFLVEDPQDVGLHAPDNLTVRHEPDYRRLEAGKGRDTDESNQSDDRERVLVGGEDHTACNRSHRAPNPEYSINTNPEGPISRHSPSESTTLLGGSTAPEMRAVGFMGALRIPGVIEFSLSLFFAKLVSYTFLYWLPLYIKDTTDLGPKTSADLSVTFDLGGIMGAILAGVLSDWSGMSATTCAFMLLLAAPMMMVYQWFGTLNYGMNIFLLIVVGLLVNGPYALITTAVSAELGTHSSLEGNSKALATVTAIIDGTGSIGAAIGPMLAALVSSRGWAQVFYMLICCDFIALVLLLRLVKHEIQRCRQHRPGPIE